MKNNNSNPIISIWEKGYLYVLIIFIYYTWWLVSGNVGKGDWYKEIAYFDYIRTALKEYSTLPYFWWNIIEDIAWRPPVPGSSSFVSNPETSFFSPLTPLIYNFNTFTYIKLYVFIQFLPGVIGIFLLKKQLNWNNEQFRNFAVLFLFSPVILQHVAVGYFTWYNFYFFPLLIYFIAERDILKGVVGTAAILSIVILQGGIYIVQYLGLFWLIYEIFHVIIEQDYKRITRIFAVPVLMFLLSYVKIFSSALVFGDYTRPFFDVSGYYLSFFLFYAIVPTITIPPLNLWFYTDYLGWPLITPHDSGQFWGLSLIMLIIVLVKYKTIVKKPNAEQQNGLNYHAIFISATFLFVISFYKIWYVMMRGIEPLQIPFFEAIKNHGIRFIMGATFGYAVLFANYSSSIWKELDKFVKTKFWFIAKKIVLIVGYLLLLGSGLAWFILKLFQQQIANKFTGVITAAYKNTGHYWLRERMEGIEENALEFYFYRFDIAYASLTHWLFVIFAVSFTIFMITYFLVKKRQLFVPIIQKFPYLKYELLLAIPLAFSTGMWMNLATSIPFDEYPIRKVIPPEVVINPEITGLSPKIVVTPKSMKITPAPQSEINNYWFPQIPANDGKLFDIISNNAEFSEKNGKLMLIAKNNKPIEVWFETTEIMQAMIITILAWIGVGGFIVFRIFRNKNIVNSTIKF